MPLRWTDSCVAAVYMTQVRRIACLQMSDRSARSHSVVTLRIECKRTVADAAGVERQSIATCRLHVADVAGSEQASEELHRSR